MTIDWREAMRATSVLSLTNTRFARQKKIANTRVNIDTNSRANVVSSAHYTAHMRVRTRIALQELLQYLQELSKT
jgi:hypothetical protein